MTSFRTIELSDPVYESDGLRFLTVKTPHLRGRGDICLFVPAVPEDTRNLPVYILLHGVYGSAWSWALKGGAHRTAQRLIDAKEMQPAIIAMPSDGLWGDGSAYFSHHQLHFDQWIAEDVVTAVRENIPEAGPDSLVCIGGLSMGGYGALCLGARFSPVFTAVSGHSSITKLDQLALFIEEPLAGYVADNRLPDVIDCILMNRAQLPALRFDCGRDDVLIKPNRLLHQQLNKLNVPHTFQEFPGGHEWTYWEEHVVDTFLFFDRQVYPSANSQ